MQCPSCDLTMRSEVVGEETIDRCKTCGGEFCTHQALRRLLFAHAPAPDAPARAYARPSPLSDPMRYRKCPVHSDDAEEELSGLLGSSSTCARRMAFGSTGESSG